MSRPINSELLDMNLEKLKLHFEAKYPRPVYYHSYCTHSKLFWAYDKKRNILYRIDDEPIFMDMDRIPVFSDYYLENLDDLLSSGEIEINGTSYTFFVLTNEVLVVRSDGELKRFYEVFGSYQHPNDWIQCYFSLLEFT